MTTNNWREEFNRKYISGELGIDTSFEVGVPLEKLCTFIETQIAQARREGAEEMKKKCLEVIPEVTLPKTERECGKNQMRDEIVEKICGVFVSSL